MISGADLVLRHGSHIDDIDFILRGLRAMWPEAVVQNASESSSVRAAVLRYPPRIESEFFVYDSEASFLSWERHGLTDANQASMLHVLWSQDSVTVVADRPDSELANHVMELLAALRANRVVLPKAA